MAEVVLDNVEKIYPDGFRAVDHLSLEIADGEFLVIVGPSGCGKSTVLRMVAGLEEISGGVVRIDGQPVNDIAPKDRDIAMVFQNYALYPHMTVFDNIGFALKLRKVPKDEISRRVRKAAKVLELENILGHKPRQLSGGQRQRVAMGRAIVRQPSVFLMDEPLSNLDARLRVQMRAGIARLQRHLRVTTLYVTHDQVEAMTMGDRVAVLDAGVLQQLDTPQTLYERPTNLFVAAFIGSPSMNLFESSIEESSSESGLAVRFGSQSLALDPEALQLRPALTSYVGRPIIAGVRPEAINDAALERAHPADQRLRAGIELVEALGSEIVVHFSIDAPPGIAGEPAPNDVGGAPQMMWTARFDPRSRVRLGEQSEMAVHTGRMQFFDLDTSAAVWG